MQRKPSLQPPSPAPTPTTPTRAPLAQFLTRPSKWFGRSASAPRVAGLAAVGDESPRASTSSVSNGPAGARKAKISRPTDPRPILDAEGYMGVPGSRSVLDLTRPSLSLSASPFASSASSPGVHAKSSLDLRYVPPPSPSSPRHNIYGNGNSNPVYGNGVYGGGAGTGDLRTTSRRAWAHSADDLRALVPPSPNLDEHPPNENDAQSGPQLHINTTISFADKLAAYRGRADSLGPTPVTGSTTSTSMSGGYSTPGTATSFQSPNKGIFTGAPLSNAPLPMPPSTTYANANANTRNSSNSLSTPLSSPGADTSAPIQMPDPFYARRRTDSERSARSGKSGKSGRSGTDVSPGSTPPSARSGAGGMTWPAILASPQQGGREGERERKGSAGASSVSISISAPMLMAPGEGGGSGSGPSGGMQGQGGMTPGHIHTRSHSFTPKLSSRLAGFGAMSPGRKGSAGEVDPAAEREGKDKEKRGVAFPFHFGGAAQSKALPPTPGSAESPPLAPPHIILEPAALLREPSNTLRPPSSVDGADGKRASQIVYATGFVNRLITPALADPRAWKAFRMEVRGTKLVLHKPPSDRAAGVRDLFPAGVVEDEEETLTVDDAGGAQRRDAGSMGRKKRAYWGRGRHPALSVAGAGAAKLQGAFSSEQAKGRLGHIEKGSFEALMHELVFATVFLRAGADEEEAAQREEQWRDYARAVLLCLPLLVGRARVETEFVRFAGYLVAGAAPEETESQRARVAWMAREYLGLHGAPVDARAWEDFRGDTIPDVIFPSTQPVMSGLSASVSTQAIYAPSPVGTPALGAAPFSPRPDGSARMVGLLDALGIQEPIAPQSPPGGAPSSPRLPQHPRGALASRMPWVALETEGLTRAVLLAIDPHLIARSLTLFHRAVLDQAPDNITAAFADCSAGDPSAPLFGSDAAPHWLTKLLLVQILGSDTSSVTTQTPGGEQQGTSRTHSRSEVISVWARVGELCRAAGDECTWRAIVAALCSAPVARLDKVWRRVEGPALAAVEGWARSEGEGCEVREPRVTPWGGAIQAKLKIEVDAARVPDGGGPEETFLVAPMERAFDVFEGFRKQFLLCPRRISLAEGEVGEEVKLLVNHWVKFVEGGGAGGIAAKFVRVDQFMSLSLAAEPRRKGLFEPHYLTRAANHAPFASLIPLLFPEVFPTATLVDRAALLRGRVDSDTDPRLLRLDPERLPNQPRRDIGGLAGLNQTGTVIPVYNGEVLLAVWHGTEGESSASSRPSSRLPSRPPSSVIDNITGEGLSRAPSVRVKPGSSQGLDRKTSVARRNSLPSPSQRRTFVASEPSTEPPLRVRVLAGTLNWLCDILVHGLQGVSVSVADDNGEMSLREGKTRELVVSQIEFSKLFFNVYRSLVTPLVFFELLRKMYLQTRPRGVVPSVAELCYVAGSRGEVFAAIEGWLTRGGGAQDVLDDAQLHSAVRAFLDDSADHDMPQSANASDPGVEQAWGTLADLRYRLRRTFTSYTMRPPAPFPSLVHPSAPLNGQHSRPQILSREPPDIDRIDPEDLVETLDALSGAAWGNVTEEDLFITADVLEVQTADPLGWFLSSFTASDSEPEIENMYSYLQAIEPSPLISDLGQDSLYRLLPPGIRSCIRAWVILRKWTISQLVAPHLGLKNRQSRMELILRAIEVTRRRSVPSYATSIVDFPCPRSFVEAVLTSAVLSVESRIHARPWLNIAANRGAQCEIPSLLTQTAAQSPSSTRELTPDVGYLLERLLEIIAAPDVMQQDGQSLINFDKRRHLCNLIISARKGNHREDVMRKAFECLNNMEKGVWLLQFDLRGIREEAQREGSSGPGSSPAAARRAVRPFQKTISQQIEKNRRDRLLRARLQKERVQEQTKNEKREDLLNKAMRKQPPTPQQKHQRGKKSMSAFLHFMRPISSAFGNESVHAPGVKRTAEELDFVPSGKPSLVISLVEARVAQFINNDRSFTFQLDTEDGGHYLLQAVNKREMARWLETINRVTQTAAKRRLTYLGNPKPQLADHLHDGPMAASRDPLAVFGVDLNFLLRREQGTDDIPPGTIPSVVERCLSEIEARGLTEVGIYRLAGATSTINALKEAFNRGTDPITEDTDIHAVCDLVKSWFRVLPEPLFPPTEYHLAIESMQMENLDDRLTSIRNVVQALPRPKFDLLKRVSEHLDRVADFEDRNQMTAEGLAIVFSPNLLRAPQENFAMILANMAHTHKLVKALITHFHVIFDEGDVDAEGDREGEGELEGEFEDDEGERQAGDDEEEEPFRMDSPTQLEDVAEEDSAEDEEYEDAAEDLPPTITAELDQSPLDFSTFALSYSLPTT